MVNRNCFSSIHNLPATYFLFGDEAEAGTWQDSHALGLSLIDVFAPEWLGWKCYAPLPDGFQNALEDIFDHHEDYSVVRKMSKHYEMFCRVLYRSMVLLGVPDSPGRKLQASPVWGVVELYSVSEEFEKDSKEHNIFDGIAFEGFRALVGDEGVELVSHLIHFDEEERWDVAAAVNSDFFIKHVEESKE